MSETLEALFALLECNDDDFPELLARFNINPATDLRYTDLANVDFGSLTTDLLDLTGANIEGADLSRVQCPKIVGRGIIDGRQDETEAANGAGDVDALEAALTAIYKYQNGEWTASKLIKNVEYSSAPAMAFYDSAAEQDILTKRLCAHFGDASHLREGAGETYGVKFLWFYSKASTARFKLNPAFLETTFFDALRLCVTSDSTGIYPSRLNQSSVARIKSAVSRGRPEAMRDEFIRAVKRELAVDQSGGLVSYRRSLILFSGFPPISKRLHEELKAALPVRLNLIFLTSAHFEPHYKEGLGVAWRRVAVPGFALGEPVADETDIIRLIRRVAVATSGRIKVPLSVERKAQKYIDRPLHELKHQFARDLTAALTPH